MLRWSHCSLLEEWCIYLLQQLHKTFQLWEGLSMWNSCQPLLMLFHGCFYVKQFWKFWFRFWKFPFPPQPTGGRWWRNCSVWWRRLCFGEPSNKMEPKYLHGHVQVQDIFFHCSSDVPCYNRLGKASLNVSWLLSLTLWITQFLVKRLTCMLLHSWWMSLKWRHWV